MATIKIKFRPFSLAGKEGTLCYQVIHERQTRLISTGYKLYLSEWDEILGKIRQPGDDPGRARYLEVLKCRTEDDIRRLEGIIRVGSPCFSRLSKSRQRFFAYARKIISQTRRMGKERTSEIYASLLNSFIRFRDKAGDVDQDKMDSGMMMEYGAYLKRNGKYPNTISFYMRTLYNRIAEEGLVENRIHSAMLIWAWKRQSSVPFRRKWLEESRTLTLTGVPL